MRPSANLREITSLASAIDAVRAFLAEYDAVLAARVKRDVQNKLQTGLKPPRRKSR
jgi:hypothetical protein